jgi:predicted component of type VI protein secretion system
VIASRADAYYRLAEAAEYLLRTEPHSPVPYLVKRAVQWGNMSLAELLYEFVGSPDDLVAIQRLLGMRGKED